jgi:hypothetical protein
MSHPPLKANPESTALTDAQVRRIDAVLFALAKRGNGFALGAATNMQGKTLDEKRRVIAGTYAMGFEMLTCIGMAIESDADPLELLLKLRDADGGVNIHGR